MIQKSKKKTQREEKSRSSVREKSKSKAKKRFGAKNNSSKRELSLSAIPQRPGRWVVGFHSVLEILKVRPQQVGELWIQSELVKDASLLEIRQLANLYQFPVDFVSSKQLGILGGGKSGVACRVLETPKLNWDILGEQERATVVVLDELVDPQNLGGILRTSWLMGVDGILVSKNRAVHLTPTVCKIASGGAEYVPVDIHTNLPRALTLLKEKGFWIYGFEEKGASDLWQTRFPEKVALVIGSEEKGMRSSIRSECDELVKICQVPSGRSYNASVAAALAVGEVCRQRQEVKEK